MSDDPDSDMDFEEGSFDDFEQKEGTLGDLWRNNPMVKVGIVIAAAVAIFGTIILFGGKEEVISDSYVPAGSEITSAPGTTKASPSYIEAIEEETEARIEEAYQTGGSALPTPIDPPLDRLTVPDEEVEEEDPLQRWRALQEARLQKELQQSQTVQPAPLPEDTGRSETIQALADIMAQQMQAILESRTQTQVSSRTMTNPDWLEQLKNEEELAEQEAAEAAAAEEEGDEFEVILLPAGQIAYAQLLTEANSDVPGPVLAQIVSGPLAGNRVLGSFEVQDEYLTLTFETIVIDGISTDIDAVALDPDTTLPGMATEVDHRYFQRVILPMAAAFIEGTANAIAESGLTTVTIQGETVAEESEDADSEQEIASGIEEAGQELREILDDMADDIEILVRIDAGTPMGILFLEPVIQPEDTVVQNDSNN